MLAAGSLGSCAPFATSRDRIRIALDGDPSTLNLLLGDDPNTFDVGLIINGFLLRTDERGNLIPDIAVRVPTLANGGIAPDGRTLRYELRRDALWHDGARVTAADVAFTLGLVSRPDVNVADRSGYNLITDVRVPSPYVVEVRLRESYSPGIATFLATAANQPYPIVPKHLLQNVLDINHASYNERPIGCGPYAVKAWRRGDVVDLERFDRYFRGIPPTKYLEMRTAPSNAALIGLWHDGQIDVAGLTGERELLEIFRKMPDANVDVYQRNTLEYLLFAHQRPALRDERVRQAIVAAIDRDRIMRDTLGPFYVPAEGDRLPGAFGYDPNLRQQPFDPSLARRMLDEVGRPAQLVLAHGTGNFESEIAVQIQAALAAVGVAVVLRQYPSALLTAPASEGGILAGGRFDLFVGGWNPGGIADTSYLYRCDTRPPAGENYSRICDPEVDAAARLELGAVDQALQRRGDVEMQRELIARTHVLYLGFVAGALATRRGLKGFKPSSIVRTYWNPWEWRW
ncbi:MAG TPA: ABC transporter substrate-binding protein [Candidatus Baltobacteraceae bacterium]